MDEEGDSPQFWLHSPSTGASTGRISSSNFFSSNLFMFIVAIAALLLLLFAFSSFPSSTSQILKPNSVRKSWDSLNVFLVLFAIACGVFARWNEDVGGNTESGLDTPAEQVSNDIQVQQTSSRTSSYELRWYELSYDSPMRATASGSGGGRLRRNSSSYPDLRQQSDWETTGGHGFRYYDDFEISRLNQSVETQPNGIIRQGITRRNEEPNAKVIPVDTFHNQPDSAAKSSSLHENPPSRPFSSPQQKKIRVHRSAPRRERLGIQNAPRTTHQQPQREDKGNTSAIKIGLTSQAKPLRRKVRRDATENKENDTWSTSESSSNAVPPPPAVDLTIPLKEKYIEPAPETSSLLKPSTPPEPNVKRTVLKQEIEVKPEAEAAPSPPLPPSTPNPTIIRPDQNQKLVKKERKKSSAKREIAMVWASIYKRKKKQHQPQQLGRADSGNYNGISQLFSEPDYTSTSQLFPPLSPAPPPPPPPPPHSVFHSLFRKAGSSKSKKIHSVPAPPPPPPLPPRQSFRTPPLQDISRPRSSTGKPPLPNRPSNYSKGEYGYMSNSGSQSPLFDIPRPPPLPPFGVPETKFVVRGDYAKIKSNTSSRSGSPESYEFDESSINEYRGGEVGRASVALCPSPDVNAKADTFIARLRGEWRLEKMNSVKEKTRMGFGPESG